MPVWSPLSLGSSASGGSSLDYNNKSSESWLGKIHTLWPAVRLGEAASELARLIGQQVASCRPGGSVRSGVFCGNHKAASSNVHNKSNHVIELIGRIRLFHLHRLGRLAKSWPRVGARVECKLASSAFYYINSPGQLSMAHAIQARKRIAHMKPLGQIVLLACSR